MKIIRWPQSEEYPPLVAPTPVVGESHGTIFFLSKPARARTTVFLSDDLFVPTFVSTTSFVSWISTDVD